MSTEYLVLSPDTAAQRPAGTTVLVILPMGGPTPLTVATRQSGFAITIR